MLLGLCMLSNLCSTEDTSKDVVWVIISKIDLVYAKGDRSTLNNVKRRLKGCRSIAIVADTT